MGWLICTKMIWPPGTLYKNDVATWNFIHKAVALPFIPARFIRIAEVTIEQISGGGRVRAKKR